MQTEILPIRLTRFYRQMGRQISRQMALPLLLPIALLMSASTQAASLDEIYTLAVINDPQLGAAKAGFMARSEVVNQENEKSELVMDSGTQDKPVMKEIIVKPDPLVCVVTHSNSMETNSKVEEEKIITKQ